MAGSTMPLAVFEEAMVSLFQTDEFGEGDFDKIQRMLSLIGKKDWSLRPRTYAVLRMINRVDLLDAFIVEGLKDIAFPYNLNQLPPALESQSIRFRFLERQQAVLTKATDLEVAGGIHRHFDHDVDSHFINFGLLGRGGFGEVHHLQSKLSLEQYARKRIHRRRAFLRNKAELALFENELKILKRLSHRHLVQFKGSYTDPKYVGILMSPVADCDLNVFLDRRPLPAASYVLLRGLFGCLTAALAYLHEQKLRHKDIKPQNILLKDQTVLITDFGCARDWSSQVHSTTSGLPDALTREYAAPEVLRHESRGASADIWSLGCVFLDMTEALNGYDQQDRVEFLKRNGTEQIFLATNLEATLLWLEQSFEGSSDIKPLAWIRRMLCEDRNDRALASSLLEDIQAYKGRHIYCGHCCNNDETSGSETSYEPSLPEQRLQTTEDSEQATLVEENETSTGLSEQKSIAVLEVDAAKLLLKEGVSSSAPTNSVYTPLNSAALNGHTEIVKLLLDKGADLSAPTSYGWTPLISAADKGHLDIVKLLLDKGADLSSSCNKGWTPLRSAANNGHVETVRLLLDKGADVSTPSHNGWTPLNSAADNGHIEIVKLLLDKGADLSTPSSNGWTPLISAADKGHTEIVELLLDKGADLSTCCDQGWTPLRSAASNNHAEVVKLLLDRGADSSIPSKNGWTPLMSAADKGHIEIVKVLLNKGAKVSTPCDEGWTPLNSAASNGHVEIVKLLLDKGADLSAP